MRELDSARVSVVGAALVMGLIAFAAGCTAATPEGLRQRIDQPVVRTVPGTYTAVYRYLLDHMRHQYGGRSPWSTSGLAVEGDLFSEEERARIIVLAVTFSAETGCVVDIAGRKPDSTTVTIYTAWPHVRRAVQQYLDHLDPATSTPRTWYLSPRGD